MRIKTACVTVHDFQRSENVTKHRKHCFVVSLFVTMDQMKPVMAFPIGSNFNQILLLFFSRTRHEQNKFCSSSFLPGQWKVSSETTVFGKLFRWSCAQNTRRSNLKLTLWPVATKPRVNTKPIVFGDDCAAKISTEEQELVERNETFLGCPLGVMLLGFFMLGSKWCGNWAEDVLRWMWLALIVPPDFRIWSRFWDKTTRCVDNHPLEDFFLCMLDFCP